MFFSALTGVLTKVRKFDPSDPPPLRLSETYEDTRISDRKLLGRPNGGKAKERERGYFRLQRVDAQRNDIQTDLAIRTGFTSILLGGCSMPSAVCVIYMQLCMFPSKGILQTAHLARSTLATRAWG